MGITKKQIQDYKNSLTIGSTFRFHKVTGRVVEKHKYFVVIERTEGYRECFCWSELLATDI